VPLIDIIDMIGLIDLAEKTNKVTNFCIEVSLYLSIYVCYIELS